MEFNRRDYKDIAKGLLRKNYWKMVLAGLVLSFAIGELIRSSVTYKVDDVMEEYPFEVGMISLLLLVIAVAFVLLVMHPLKYGGKKFFLKNVNDESVDNSVLLDGFRDGNLGRCAGTFFYRDLMVFLFTLLLVIPGIIKSYEYYFVGELLVDHPELTGKDVCALSKEMTRGHKMDLFVLDLSFILWGIANSLTCGLVGIFYFYPYRHQTQAVAYLDLVRQGADPAR